LRTRRASRPNRKSAYETLCHGLESLGRAIGIRAKSELAIATRESLSDQSPERKWFPKARYDARTSRAAEVQANLDLAVLPMAVETVLAASKTIWILTILALVPCSVVLIVLLGTWPWCAMLPTSILIAYAAKGAVLGYPRSAASKRAGRILKGSSSAINLMIMSLRLHPSLPKAIDFASRSDSDFSNELKRSVWEVIMCRHPSFEDSLQALSGRWSMYSRDLRSAISALVTASCEATEEGRRRALDRANNAVVTGAKRRIEEYALSLSVPSMVMFGVGILLPMMVGSFLPMLSWGVWSGHSLGVNIDDSSDNTMVETLFLMNFLFPAIALVVAVEAVSRHPLEDGAPEANGSHGKLACEGAFTITLMIAFGALSTLLVHGFLVYPAILFSAILPFAGWLGISGSKHKSRAITLEQQGQEDALFRTGAYMVEGENFELAMDKASLDQSAGGARLLRCISLRTSAMGQDFRQALEEEGTKAGAANVSEALDVVRRSAEKDELRAGMLAMDLAAYIKDLTDLERILKARLKPTISMMRLTTHFLGPIVLGVTYAIYLSLASITGAEAGSMPGGILFLTLAAFLAETNSIVSYFAWGIEGKGSRADLMRSVGICLLVSELIYCTTAVVAS
jgi:F0F1-type ATP synthase assembly protein I